MMNIRSSFVAERFEIIQNTIGSDVSQECTDRFVPFYLMPCGAYAAAAIADRLWEFTFWYHHDEGEKKSWR